MLDPIMRAMEQADNLMALGAQLKTYGIKYEFIMLDMVPAHYRIQNGAQVVTICSPKYADDDATIVNGLAMEVA